ncbi:FecCD family ABC transporter permease [Streptococcus hyointestinalis]|uniref:FecCD family ABC transporter permease n=1 Tax=Streptococcus hyointestinalis TaxID=1337 RepID=UPI003D002E29
MMTRQRLITSYLILAGLLGLAILLSLSMGYARSSFLDVIDLILGQSSSAMTFIMTTIRLPRIIACLFGGASLALAGMLLQTLTKNPLADSGILGINTGAGFMIALVIGYLDMTSASDISLLPFMAMLGGIATIATVYLMARKKNHGISPTRLIVTGVGVATMLSGVMVSITSTLSPDKMDYIISFLSGKVSGATWENIALFAPFVLLWLITYSRSRYLNIMALNEQTALALGLDLKRERLITIILSTALAALSVVMIGNITFVGLVAGHITRRFMGGDHRIILPFGMMTGMILLLVADTIGRVLLVGSGIPTGLVVSCIGAPYFLWLMSKTNEK